MLYPQFLNHISQQPLTFQLIVDSMTALVQASSPLLQVSTIEKVSTPYQTGIIVDRMEEVRVDRNITGQHAIQVINGQGRPIVVNQYAWVGLGFHTLGGSYDPIEMYQKYIIPASARLAHEIEKTVAVTVATLPSLFTASDPITFTDLSTAMLILDSRGVSPTVDKCNLVFNSMTMPDVLSLQQLTGLATQSQDQLRLTGKYNPILGWDVWHSHELPTHVAGSANPLGITINSPLNTSGSSLFAFSLNGGGALHKGDAFQIVGHQMSYQVLADTTATNGVFTTSIFPPLQMNVPANTGVLLLLKSGPTSVALTNKAIGIVFLEMPVFEAAAGGGEFYRGSYQQSGVSLRLRRFWDNVSAQLVLVAEARWGVEIANPEMAVLIR